MKPLNKLISENASATRAESAAVIVPVDTLGTLVGALQVARASMTDLLTHGFTDRTMGNVRNVDLPIIERAIKAGERAQAAPKAAAGDFTSVTSTMEIKVDCPVCAERAVKSAPAVNPLKPVWRPGLSSVKAGGIQIQASGPRADDGLVSVDLPSNDDVSVVCLSRNTAEDLADVLEGEDSAFFGVCLYEESDVLRVNGAHDEDDGDIEFMFPIMNVNGVYDTYVLQVIGEDDARLLAAFIRKGLEATK